MNKYGAKRCTADGYWFDSLAERERYYGLVLLRHAGEITDLEVHPRFDLFVPRKINTDVRVSTGLRHSQPALIAPVKVGYYEPDFRYRTARGTVVIEDVKSPATAKNPTYRLKKKMVEALYNVKIVEVLR